MFRAPFCSSSGGTVYTAIGIFKRIMSTYNAQNTLIAVYTVPPDDEQKRGGNMQWLLIDIN
jgi:hypothetical protein